MEKDESQMLLETEQLSFALDSVYVNKTSSVGTVRKYSKAQLQKFLAQPLINRLPLQEISLDLFQTSGLYQRIVLYYSNLFTFDHFIYPTGANYKNMMKNMIASAEYLDILQVKHNCRYILEEWVKLGEVFFYELEDREGIILKKIPNSLCRINRNEAGVLRYQIDCSKLSDREIDDNGFPEEFRRLYKEYTKGVERRTKLKSDPTLEPKWREVSEKGVAFSFNIDMSNSVPVFTNLFESLLYYRERALKQDEYVDAENLKLIHMKTPMDKESGKLLMDFKLAKTFHEAAKRNLPSNVAIATNPLEMEVLNVKSNTSESMSDLVLKNAIDRIFDESGISNALFNGDKVTSEILKQTILSDSTVIIRALGLLENWINYKLNKNTKTKKFKMTFIPSTIFDKENYLKNAKENLSFGGSRMYYLACCGLTPLQTVSMLSFEIENDFDRLLVPAKTSHTLSKEDTKQQNGGSSKDNKKDTEEEITDANEQNKELE